MEKTNLHLEVGIELYLTLDMNIKNWNVNFRPWYHWYGRWKSNITKFVGDAELEIATQFGKHFIRWSIIRLVLLKGNIQLNYVFPIHGHLRVTLKFFKVTETLIDYNVKQTTIGIRVSFANW
jgi:outer membrane phospholipase A